MGEEVAVDRNTFISKMGTYFIVVSLFAIIIFVASDVSRNDPGRKALATQIYIVESVQALQTRDAGSTMVAPGNLPTPTLVPIAISGTGNEIADYFPIFCLGSLGLLIGGVLKRISAPPPKPGARFEGLRRMREKQREAKAKREAEKKEKLQRRSGDRK